MFNSGAKNLRLQKKPSRRSTVGTFLRIGRQSGIPEEFYQIDSRMTRTGRTGWEDGLGGRAGGGPIKDTEEGLRGRAEWDELEFCTQEPSWREFPGLCVRGGER